MRERTPFLPHVHSGVLQGHRLGALRGHTGHAPEGAHSAPGGLHHLYSATGLEELLDQGSLMCFHHDIILYHAMAWVKEEVE